jgi:hypothetical protein
VVVGPGRVTVGAVVGNWESFDITSLVNFTTNATWVAHKRRVGENMEIRARADFSGATDAGTFHMYLPDSLTMDEIKLGSPGAYEANVGNGHILDAGTGKRFVSPCFYQPTRVRFLWENSASDSTLVVNNTSPITIASGDSFEFNLSVPILEWADTGTVNMISENNLTGWTDYTPVISQGGSLDTNSYCRYKRVGDSIHIQQRFTITSTTASAVQVDLPLSLTVASNSGTAIVGVGSLHATGTTILGVRIDPGNSYYELVDRGAANSYATITGSTIGSENVVLDMIIPIAEWANQPSPLVGFAEATQENMGLIKKSKAFAIIETHAGVAINTGVEVALNWVTSVQDPYNAYSGGTYTIPEDGLYMISIHAGSSGNRATTMRIKRNAATIHEDKKSATNTFHSAMTMYYCSTGDTITGHITNDGSNATIAGASNKNRFSIHKVNW